MRVRAFVRKQARNRLAICTRKLVVAFRALLFLRLFSPHRASSICSLYLFLADDENKNTATRGQKEEEEEEDEEKKRERAPDAAEANREVHTRGETAKRYGGTQGRFDIT